MFGRFWFEEMPYSLLPFVDQTPNHEDQSTVGHTPGIAYGHTAF